MLQTQDRIAKRFDGTIGKVGFFFGPAVPQTEPTPATRHWLKTVMRHRAGDAVLVGVLRGRWVELMDSEELNTYHVRQLCRRSMEPMFYGFDQAKSMRCSDVRTETLRLELETLFVYHVGRR